MTATSSSPLLDFYPATARVDYAGMTAAGGGVSLDGADNLLVDLSPLQKIMVAGNRAQAWVAAHADHHTEALFAVNTGAHGVSVRLHWQQYLLIARTVTEPPPWLAAVAHGEAAPGVLVLTHDCAEFAVFGAVRDVLLHELTDLPAQAIAVDTWVQTRLAHAEVGIRLVTQPRPHWRVVCSPADATCLVALIADIVRSEAGMLTTLDVYQNACG